MSDEEWGISIEEMMRLIPGLRSHRVASFECARDSDDERVLLTMGRLEGGKSPVVCGRCGVIVDTLSKERFFEICQWLSS